MPEAPTRVVVVEDEPLARQALVDDLRAVEWITVVGEAGDGPTATIVLRACQPHLALMDINLPGYGALAVIERLARPPAVIFVTAHDRFAAAAFDLAAVDYVLKPYSAGRLLLALQRARDAIRHRDADDRDSGSTVPTVLERARSALASDEPIDTIYVRDHGSIIGVPLSEVTRFESDGTYVAVYARGRRFLVQMALADVERRLCVDRFLRIHRCRIVNLGHVSRFVPHERGRFTAVMRDGSRVVASRRYSRAVRQLAR